MFGKHRAHVIRHGAEVLADDQPIRARRLDGENRDHRLVVIGDIRSAARALALRNPPQAEQSKHMVNAYRARMGEHGMHHVAVHRIAGFGQVLRIERRLAPILPLLVVEIRRTAHGDAADGEPFGIPPHVRAERMHAHGHILNQTERHAAVAGRTLRVGHLPICDPLQPAFEVDHVGVVAHQCGHFRRIAVRVMEPHAFPGRSPNLEGHGPCGERLKIRSCGPLERIECGLAFGGARHGVDESQRLALVPPRGIDVHRLRAVVGRHDLVVQPLHFGFALRGEPRVLRNVLRADIGDVEEASGLRQIRRRLKRLDGRGGMDRIDQHEIGVRLLCRVDEQFPQVAVVAHAPGLRGTDGIHLRHPPPALSFRHRGGRRDARRRADERGIAMPRSRFDVQGMVSHRNIVGQIEAQRAVILFDEVGTKTAHVG